MPVPTEERQQLSSVKAQMRQLAQNYARQLPNLDAHSLMLGLKDTRLEFLPLGEREGMYDPVHRLILINSQVRPERQRFTLAHEISHALLQQDDDLLSDLHDLYDGERLEEVIEVLCNVGAAALLIRPELLDELLERFGHTGRTLAELMKRADVSASVAMYTLCEVAPQPMLYALCALESRSATANTATATAQLRVRASSNASGWRYSLSVGTPIPERHPVHDALTIGEQMSQKSVIPFRSGKHIPAQVVAFAVNQHAVAASFVPLRGSKSGSKASV